MLLTFALSWGWSLTLVAMGEVVRQGRGWPTNVPALVAPAASAVLVTAWTGGRAGLCDLGARVVRRRIGWRWWLAAASPLGFLAVALGAVALAGAAPAAGDFGRYSGWPELGVGGVVLAAGVNAVGEEVGWRGFALPALLPRLGARRAAFAVGAMWATWHAPYFLLLASYRGFGPLTVAGFAVGVMAGSVVLAWLYLGSGGSILACAVWHACFNLAAATAASTGGIAVVVSALVIAQAVVLLRRGALPARPPGASRRAADATTLRTAGSVATPRRRPG